VAKRAMFALTLSHMPPLRCSPQTSDPFGGRELAYRRTMTTSQITSTYIFVRRSSRAVEQSSASSSRFRRQRYSAPAARSSGRGTVRLGDDNRIAVTHSVCSQPEPSTRVKAGVAPPFCPDLEYLHHERDGVALLEPLADGFSCGWGKGAERFRLSDLTAPRSTNRHQSSAMRSQLKYC
jgi:hypothetical protein